MAAMTSTFLGSAVAVKAPVVVSSKKAVAPVASLDGLKKVRAARIDSILFHGENVPCRSIAGEKTYPPPGRRPSARGARAIDASATRRCARSIDRPPRAFSVSIARVRRSRVAPRVLLGSRRRRIIYHRSTRRLTDDPSFFLSRLRRLPSSASPRSSSRPPRSRRPSSSAATTASSASSCVPLPAPRVSRDRRSRTSSRINPSRPASRGNTATTPRV